MILEKSIFQELLIFLLLLLLLLFQKKDKGEENSLKLV